VRRVSKYALDRNQVDLQRLKKEKQQYQADNAKIKKDEVEKTIKEKKELEVVEKTKKLEILS